jgi:hypothetical protein
MDEVINYVMETPGNTNPNVLKGILEKGGGGNGGEENAVWIDRELVEETSSYYMYRLKKTAEEIMAYVNSGKVVFIQDPYGNSYGRFACTAGSVGTGNFLCVYTDRGTAASSSSVTFGSKVYVNAEAVWSWPDTSNTDRYPKRTIVKGGSND